jgi:S-adenosylmethionine hydrolase
MSQTFVSPSSRPVIALLTDFGLGDGDVGVMKGVIAGIHPDAQIIDITHDVAPQNVPSAAWILAASYRYFPRGTAFVCVVDPGVGSSRGAIAVHANDWYFVGPDNGLFSYIYAEQGVESVVALTNHAYHLPQVSSTFHGRDIFAPTGAYLARGVALEELGPLLDPTTLVRLDITALVRHGSQIEGRIVHVDNFGNLITCIPLTMVPELFTCEAVKAIFPIGAVVEQRQRFFAEGPLDGQPFIYADSSGYMGIAIRNGNAAASLNVGFGTPLTFISTV